MKKLYAILAAATMLAGSASAQSLFFKGNGVGLSWDEGNDMEVALTDGAYTAVIPNLTAFKVSTVSSADGWSTYNTGALFANGADKIENLGVALALEKNADGPNINVPYTGDYTVVISGDLSTITLTTTTPVPTGFTEIFLRGDMNNWLNDASDDVKATWQMQTLDGVVYWFDCKGETAIFAGQGFKIADANWGKINYGLGDEIIPFEDPLTWNYNGNNSVMGEDYEGTIKFELTNGAGNAAQVTVFPELSDENPFAGVESVAVDTTAAAEYFNLQGVRVAEPQSGLYIVRRGSAVTKVMVK